MSFRHFGIREGLPSAEVYEIYQDDKGFIWLATDNGVVRFDGHDMQTLQAKDGIPDPIVFGFFLDMHKRLWFRSYSGLISWYKNDTIRQYEFNDTLSKICSKSLLRSISIDSAEQLWFSTDNRTGRITKKGEVIFETGSADRFDFWKNFNDCSVEWRGKKYVSAENNLFEVQSDGLHRVLKTNDPIVSLSADRKGNLWIGYLHAPVERFASENLTNPYTPDFLEDQIVTRVIQDAQMGYWISTLKNGIYYIPDIQFERQTIRAVSDVLIAIPQDDHILVGDANGSLALLKNNGLTSLAKTVLKNESILCAFSDSHGNYWIAGGRKLFLFDSALRLKNTMPFYVRGFYEDPIGTVHGFDNARTLQFDLEGNITEAAPVKSAHRSMIKSGAYVLMAGRTGFDIFDAKFNLIRSPEAFKQYKISDIVNLNDTTILLATIGSGFFVVSKKTWQPIQLAGTESSIERNIYCSLTIDSMVWLGTEKGVMIASIATLLSRRPSFTFLTDKGGLVNDKVDLLRRVGNKVWVFSGNAVAIVPADPAKFAPTRTVFYLKETRVNNKEWNLRTHPILAAGENNLQITFGFIDFKSNSITVRSRLNRRSEWNYSEQRTLSFNRLAPGKYLLEIEYSTDKYHWTKADASIRFSISAPWWQRWQFQLAVATLVLLVGYLMVRSRISVLQERNAHLRVVNDHKQNLIQAEIETMERERSRIAKDLHDGAGMNLTVLKLKINQAFKNQPDTNSRDIISDLDGTIQDIRDLIYNLTPSGLYRNGLSDSVENYIQRNLSDLEIKIDVFSSGFKITNERISLISFRILQELINNSVKHSGATTISIDLNAFDDEISILYQDNGKGFDPAAVKHGAGLLNIESRLGLIDGKMSFSSNELGVSYAFSIPYPPPAG